MAITHIILCMYYMIYLSMIYTKTFEYCLEIHLQYIFDRQYLYIIRNACISNSVTSFALTDFQTELNDHLHYLCFTFPTYYHILNRENRFVIKRTVYPKKYAHGFCFAVLCCGYTLSDFPLSIRLTSLALWQSNDCPSASKATLMNMDKYFMWIHYERLHNHNKVKHNKTVCIFLGIYCNISFRMCLSFLYFCCRYIICGLWIHITYSLILVQSYN